MRGEIKVRIIEDLPWGRFDLYVYQEDDAPEKIWIARPDENGNLVFTEQPNYVHVEPTFRFPRRVGVEILRAIQRELDGLGIRPEKASHTEGLLEATTGWLEDLRFLLKLPDRPREAKKP